METGHLYARIRKLEKENKFLSENRDWWKRTSFMRDEEIVKLNEEIAKLREENVNLQKRNTNLYRDCMNKERSLSESNKCISQLGDSIVNAVKRHDAEIENLKDVIFEMGDELMEANTELCFFDSIRSTLDEYTECMAELYPIIGSKTV